MLACHSRREGHPESPNFGAIYSPGQSKPLSVSSFLLLSTRPNLNLQDIPQRSVKQVTPRSSLIFKNSIAASIYSRGSLYLSWAHRLDTMELLRSLLTKTRCLSKEKKPEMPTPNFPIQGKWGIVNLDASNLQRMLRMVQEIKPVGIFPFYIQPSSPGD